MNDKNKEILQASDKQMKEYMKTYSYAINCRQKA